MIWLATIGYFVIGLAVARIVYWCDTRVDEEIDRVSNTHDETAFAPLIIGLFWPAAMVVAIFAGIVGICTLIVTTGIDSPAVQIAKRQERKRIERENEKKLKEAERIVAEYNL